MKKIGLITFHDTTNFGSLLQTYGLYKKINSLGYDCEVIDYQCANIVKREHPQPVEWKGSLKTYLKDIILTAIKRKKYRKLHAFLLKEMNMSTECDIHNISQLRCNYDKFVIGSDITWGMDIIDSDMTFFLDFESERNKKAAFAASIGNPWTSRDKEKIKPLLSEFDFIAVREEESADWVQELTGNRPVVVCDPTMLLTGTDWKRFCFRSTDKDEYVLVYFDNNNGDCLTNARQYAHKHGLAVKMIGYGAPRKDVDIVRPYSLEQFLSLISNAAFVITASYHGMLFSIYFQKEFAYYNRAHKSRMNTLAEKLGVQGRDGSRYDVMDMPLINYCSVNRSVEKYRNDSTEVLKELLSR